ncbi:hypothetical protein C2S51_009543 [Perilla frutescens var. frutescens]|nr:hypothetical protein C2S51_009543 [Perilla frutescens var. frutescens]
MYINSPNYKIHSKFQISNFSEIFHRDDEPEPKMSRHPLVKWAQRSDKLFITIELPDAKNVKLKLDAEGKFSFSATSGADNRAYEIDFDLYDKVDVDESKASTTTRNIVYLVKKVESKWWSRLLKQEGKPPVFLKVDWDKWVDEDEEKPGGDMDFGDFDFSKLNMGGAEDFDTGGADEDEDDESDTDEEENEKPSATVNKGHEAAPAISESVEKS